MAKSTYKRPPARKEAPVAYTVVFKWQQTPGMYLAGKAYLDEVDKVEIEMTRKWGPGRLRLLVTPELREKFDRQRYLKSQAVWEGELEDVRREAARMITAWNVLDRHATQNGAQPVKPTVWETRLPCGKIAAIVKEPEAVRDVVAEGRHTLIYTLDEIGRLIEGFPELCAIKETIPGAIVEDVAQKVRDPMGAALTPDEGIVDVKEPIDGPTRKFNNAPRRSASPLHGDGDDVPF